MPEPERSRRRTQSSTQRFADGIKGKVLESVRVTNAPDARYIALEFEDKTELTISLDVHLSGKLELFDWRTGDQKLIGKVGQLPHDRPLSLGE